MGKYKRPWWVWIIIIIFVGSTLTNIGPFVIPLIVVWFFCANKCVDWAAQIDKNKDIAFLIGFILSLVGLFGYWIYYERRLKNGTKNKI